MKTMREKRAENKILKEAMKTTPSDSIAKTGLTLTAVVRILCERELKRINQH